MNVVQHQLTGALREALTPGTEFWDASKTLKNLAEATYFIEEEECKSDEEGQTLDARGCEVMWPEVLKDMFSAGEWQWRNLQIVFILPLLHHPMYICMYVLHVQYYGVW